MHPFDLRPFNLGFYMGTHYGTYDATTFAPLTQGSSRLKEVRLVGKPGINLGLITNLNLGDNFDFRFVPSVSLEQRDFEFRFFSQTPLVDSVVIKKVEASNLNLPFMVKFKSNYYKRVRVYCVGGIQASVNMASTKKVKNDPNLLKTQSLDIAGVAAVGVDLYGERLKLSPEIRFTHGINNLYIPKNVTFANAIGDFRSQALIFSLNFE